MIKLIEASVLWLFHNLLRGEVEMEDLDLVKWKEIVISHRASRFTKDRIYHSSDSFDSFCNKCECHV